MNRWNPRAHNFWCLWLPQSLPGNKMASAGSDWRTNPITLLKLRVTKGRYVGMVLIDIGHQSYGGASN